MKLSDLEDADKILTRDYLEIALGRLENKLAQAMNTLDARINALDARINGLEGKLNNQRTLIWVAIIGIAAQIINAWILHK